MLITTLPSVHRPGLIEKMCAHSIVDGMRYNVGIRTSYSPLNVLSYLKKVANGKKLWVDLKGRQIRITKWADPTYGDIELTHEIEVDLPARVFFRGGQWSSIVEVDGNKIMVDPDPKEAIGAGQAINIIGQNLKIKGDYLTEMDKQHIIAAKQLGIHDYMLSFVEQDSDLEDVKLLDPDAKMVLKIESLKGLAYVPHTTANLMAARDDLMINIGENKAEIINALKLIIEKDPEAMVASCILTSRILTMADISDLALLHNMGYKHYVLSDDVSHNRFDESVKKFEMVQKCFLS